MGRRWAPVDGSRAIPCRPVLDPGRTVTPVQRQSRSDRRRVLVAVV